MTNSINNDDTNFDGVINPPAEWVDVPRLSNNAVALAGPDGPMNAQANALVKQTKYLKDEIENQQQRLLDTSSPENGAALVGFKQTGSGAVSQTMADKGKQWLHPKDYGVVGDGETDDTEAVRSLHAYANSIRVPVTYNGINRLLLQADANIHIETSVDFCGCEILPLGGFNLSPSFDTINKMFVVRDPDCPLVEGIHNITPSNLAKGSRTPVIEVFQGHGFVLVESQYQIPNRGTTGTTNYTQSFKSNRFGIVTYPVSADLSGHPNDVKVSYRKTSRRKLRLSNVVLLEDGSWNNQSLFYIERCNVIIDGFDVPFDANSPTYNNIDQLIWIDNSSDIWIKNVTASGRPTTEPIGSYLLAIYGGADIYLDGVDAVGGWGATGTNNVNGLHVTRSLLNRVDAHSSGHNIFVTDSVLVFFGILYGWGGGVIKASNCQVINASAITNRVDYSGQFFGKLIVEDCEFSVLNNNRLAAVNLLSNPLGASTPIQAPDVIVRNCSRLMLSPSINNFGGVHLRAKDGCTVYAPRLISQSGLRANGDWGFTSIIHFNSLSDNGADCLVIAEDIPATLRRDLEGGAYGGLTDTDGIYSLATPKYKIRCRNVENLFLSCRAPNAPDIVVDGGSLGGLEVDRSSPTQPRCQIRGIRFDTISFTQGPLTIIGGGTGGGGYTSIDGASFRQNVRGLSLASAAALSRIIFEDISSPSLPPGVTRDDAFFGWRAPELS